MHAVATLSRKGPRARRRGDRGLVLLDVLFGMVLFGLLAATAVQEYAAQRDEARQAQALSDARQFRTVLTTETGRLPADATSLLASLPDLGVNLTAGNTVGGYLPDGDDYHLCVVQRHGGRIAAWAAFDSATGSTRHGETGAPPLCGYGGGLGSVAAGREVSPAGVVAWGNNASGQQNVPPTVGPVVQVAGGYHFGLALRANGTVAAWGAGAAASVPAGLTGVVQIAAGGYHALALKADGTVTAWGSNPNGETAVPPGLRSVVQIAAGTYHSLAVRADGTVVGWGHSGSGRTTPPAGLTDAVQVAAGYDFSLALRANGTVVGFGSNTYYQQGVAAGHSDITQIAAGAFHALALRENGQVLAKGNAGGGRSTVPSGLGGVVQVAAGISWSMALDDDGQVTMWGTWDGGAAASPVPAAAGANHIGGGPIARHASAAVP